LSPLSFNRIVKLNENREHLSPCGTMILQRFTVPPKKERCSHAEIIPFFMSEMQSVSKLLSLWQRF
jgi:hypothetical protein